MGNGFDELLADLEGTGKFQGPYSQIFIFFKNKLECLLIKIGKF